MIAHCTTNNPEYIVLNCSNASNPLILPEKVSEFISVKKLTIENAKICSLLNLPKKLEILIVKKSEFIFSTSLSGVILPKTLKILTIIDSNLTNIDLSCMSNLQNIVLTNNDLVEINELPRMLKSLMLQENRNLNVNNIPNFSNLENLKDLSLKKTCLNDLENIPNSVEKLEISYNNLKKINNLPKNLKMLDASNCQLKSIDEISLVATNLKYLNLSNNMIEILPTLPDTIEEVNISDNLLVKIENNIMPGQLKVFNIDNNKNLQLSEIQMNNLRNLINPGNLSNSNNLCKKNKTDDISEIIAKICSDMFIPLTGEKNLIKHKYEVKV
jgi:hypothetical protein